MGRFSLKEVGELLDVASLPPTPICSFQYDSRMVGPGDLFFALPGKKVDGHTFIEEVRSQGAVGAVVSTRYCDRGDGFPLIRVDDVLLALQSLAQKAVAQSRSKIIGITGSVGKTTVKEWIATLLEKRFLIAKTPGSINSQVGLPCFLLNCSGKEEWLVVEMGMSEKGEITRLVNMAPPDIAVITRIGLAHSAFFPDGLIGIAQAKAEIFSHSKTSLAVMSSQALSFDVIKSRGTFPKISYAVDGSYGDYVIEMEGEIAKVSKKGVPLGTWTLPLQGSHLREDFLAACAVAYEIGLSTDEIRDRVPYLKGVARRFEMTLKEGVMFCNDAYNANPVSMKAALENLPNPQEGGQVIAILGEMHELGSFSETSHLEIGKIALSRVSYLLCLGQGCRPMVDLFKAGSKKAELCLSLEEVRGRLRDLASPGDVVLLKGSKGHGLWKLLED